MSNELVPLQEWFTTMFTLPDFVPGVPVHVFAEIVLEGEPDMANFTFKWAILAMNHGMVSQTA